MVLPAGVLVALGELAMSPKVQDFASGLIKNVYGRIMPVRKAGAASDDPSAPPLTIDDIAEKVEGLPSKEELITAFSVLQANIDRQNQRTRAFMVAAAAAQIAVVLGLAALMVM